LNTKHESSKFDNVEDVWDNFRKTICEVANCVLEKVADGVLGKKVKTAARNISKKALCLMERRKGLYNNCLKNYPKTRHNGI